MDTLGGDVDLRCGHFLAKMCAKMKELGPIGGGVHLAHPPISTNDTVVAVSDTYWDDISDEYSNLE